MIRPMQAVRWLGPFAAGLLVACVDAMPSDLPARPAAGPATEPMNTDSTEAPMPTEALDAFLQQSTDPPGLAKASLSLARSPLSGDHALLLRYLGTRGFLDRLDPPEAAQGVPEHLRVRRVLLVLAENPAPTASEGIVALTQDPLYDDDLRAIALIAATAKVRPAPAELVAFWRKWSDPEEGFPADTVAAMVENGSQPALDEVERMLLSPQFDDEEKLDWMRTSVLTHRDRAALIDSCGRLLAGPLPDGLKPELVDVLFDYRPADWFRPSVSYQPPAISGYTPEARDAAGRVARFALEQMDLSDERRAAVQRFVAELDQR